MDRSFGRLGRDRVENGIHLVVGPGSSPFSLVGLWRSRTRDRDRPVSTRTAEAQLRAIREWGAVPSSKRYATLQNIKHPTLIVHGNKDIVVLPINAFILAELLPDAQLIMYPDSNHGAYSQHAELFLKHARLFLGA